MITTRTALFPCERCWLPRNCERADTIRRILDNLDIRRDHSIEADTTLGKEMQ